MSKKTYHIVDPDTGESADKIESIDSKSPDEQTHSGKEGLIQFGKAYRESSTLGKIGLILFAIGIVCMPLTIIFLFLTALFSKSMISFWGIATMVCCVTSVVCLLLCDIGDDG